MTSADKQIPLYSLGSVNRGEAECREKEHYKAAQDSGSDVTWKRSNNNKEKKREDLCNAAIHVFSDVHSENSSLAGSEKGCEKLKKPRQSTKTEPDGV